MLLFVWAELAVLGSAKTALKFKYEIKKAFQSMRQDTKMKSDRDNP